VAIERGMGNGVQLDRSKMEAAFFIRPRGDRFRRNIIGLRIVVGGVKADINLTLNPILVRRIPPRQAVIPNKSLFHVPIEGLNTQIRLCLLCRANGLNLELIRRLQRAML
jgi:hypothetical protein